MLRRIATSRVAALAAANVPPAVVVQQFRGIAADRVRGGNIVKFNDKYWRVISSAKSQKGQHAAVFFIRMVEVGKPKSVKEQSFPPNVDFAEVRAFKQKMLFSGFDDEDMACFVYPQHMPNAGEEVNMAGTSLSDQQQAWLKTGMEVDLLELHDDEAEKVTRPEVFMPVNSTYTVERLQKKGMFLLAHFVECDGTLSVPDNVQLGDTIKVALKPDGTVGFQGKL